MPVIRSRHLTVEALEDRAVPATWNVPWPDAGHLTLSFAPDGTDVGQQTSDLYQTLNSAAPTGTWQLQVLQAFQQWAREANVNIGLVSDGGQPLGSPGKPLSDPRFGDIRIAGASYGKSVLAFSSPFDVLATTWSGDVRVNAPLFQSAGEKPYDLFTAMLQEAGHTLGIGNSTDPGSVMYEEYLGTRANLSADDIASVQALYGVRRADAFEGAGGNETLATASRLRLIEDANGILSVVADADLTTAGDRDVFSFRAPTLTTGLIVRLHRAGLSLVTPRLTVYDSLGRVIGAAESADPVGGNLELRLSGISPLGQYYVKVEGAGDDPFRVGAYKLEVQSLALVNALGGAVPSTVNTLGQALTNNDLHTNDSFLTASNLLSGLFAPDSKFDVAYRGSISDTWDVDYYQVQAPTTMSGDKVLTVMTWATGPSTLIPRVKVYDASYRWVPAEVLVNDGGVVTIQVAGVTAGATYYVRLDSAVSRGPAAVGNYFLGIDFGTRATDLKRVVASSLTPSKPQASSELTVHGTALFHFVLAANTAAGVEMTILDKKGAVVRTVTAVAGTPVSVTLTLDPGQYTFSFRSPGAAAVGYQLKMALLTDPIGPQAKDPCDAATTDRGGSADWEDDTYWYYWDSGDTGGVKSQDAPPTYRG
ncbi:MAG: matrixin family metalloprotease [Gemmataceae bacterium]